MTPDSVYVMWTDAGHMNDWNTASRVADWSENDARFIVETSGFLVGESEDWVLVALSVSVENGMVHSPIRIMRTNILEMEITNNDNKETKSD